MDDFLLLEQQYSQEELMIAKSVKQFVTEQAYPLLLDAYEKATFPKSLIKPMAELGLFGMTLPTEVGGSAASALAYGLVCQELERGDSGLRSFVSVQSSLVMFPIYTYGTEEQHKRFLPLLAQGRLIGCFGLTEADSGSDPASMKTTAKPVDGGWLLNGSKLWITNAGIADLAVVWAKTPDGIRGFIVEKEFSGFTMNEIHYKASLRASVSGELIFNDCFIPESNFLVNSDRGIVAALSCLTQARYGIAWGTIGAAMACFDKAREYCLERQQFGKPLASFQLIQQSLVRMYTEINKAQCLNLQIARLKEQEQSSPQMISMAKMNACKQSLNIARECRNLLGGNGISLEYDVIRHMMNLESVFTYEGTDNVHTLILGRHITGINAFS